MFIDLLSIVNREVWVEFELVVGKEWIFGRFSTSFFFRCFR